MPTFSTLHFGEPSTPRQETSLTGAGGETATSWALQTSLVVEVVHAVAPGANILLVTTSTPLTRGGFADLMDAEQNVIDNGLAQVILQGFGASEQFFNPNELQSLRHAFISAQQHGVTVLAPSGDGGAVGTTSELSVEWPASDPLVLGVGGTYLCTHPLATATTPRTVDTADPPARCQHNPGQAEVGWTLSGGGFSQLFSRPIYQNTLPAGSTVIGAMRGVPDVSSQASALAGALVFDSLDGNGGLACGPQPCSTGWYDAGGTALATSEWAALVAIAVQFNGQHGLGLINPALYKLASDPTYARDFFDVSVGTNSVNSVTGYPATTGWDPVTGLGTPNAANLVPDLVAASH
jgi:subtilase family serine protease